MTASKKTGGLMGTTLSIGGKKHWVTMVEKKQRYKAGGHLMIPKQAEAGSRSWGGKVETEKR